MKRRSLLVTLGGGAISSLAGCSALPLGDSSDDSGTTDSDLDGVPDKDDYAPWDPDVQEKSDVLDEYWGRNVDPDGNTSPVSDLVIGDTQPSSLQAEEDATPANGMSGFTSYSRDSISVYVRESDRSNEDERVLVVARKFPQRGVVDYARSDVITNQGSIEVSVDIGDSLEPSEEPLYYSAYLVRDDDISELEADSLTYLHESDPFIVNENGLSSASTGRGLNPVEGDGHARTPIEGGYLVELSGRTAGTEWKFRYFVSRSAYERKVMEPRGRSRYEYARYALSNGTGRTFIDIVQDAAQRTGFTSKTDQAEFAIDVVQSLPYVKDRIGTGYDEYPKFIEETLTEAEGDCEDTTIALAVLLVGMGYDIVLIRFPSHIGVGIAGDFSGSYVDYDHKQYYYIETTSEGWDIGDLPTKLDTSEVDITPV